MIEKLIMELKALDVKVERARQTRLKAEDKESEQKKLRAVKEEELIALMSAENTESWKTPKGVKAEMVKKEYFNIKVSKSFYKYVADNNAFDLLQRRLNNKAIADRHGDGEKIPGLSKFTKRTIKVTT